MIFYVQPKRTNATKYGPPGVHSETQKLYLSQIRFFESFHQQLAENLDSSAVREYLHHLITVKNLSRSRINIAYSALKFFFASTLQQDWVMKEIPRAKKISRLPVVLTRGEIEHLFSGSFQILNI